MHNEPLDGIDHRRKQWERELPEIDTAGMAILGRMRLITLLVRPQIEAIFKEHKLDTGETDVIFTLLRSGSPYCLRPTELFKSLMVSSGGMTSRLERLLKAGLIQRIADEDDGRSLLVQLTEQGIVCARNAFKSDMMVETQILSGLSQQEQEQLAHLLRKLTLSIKSASD